MVLNTEERASGLAAGLSFSPEQQQQFLAMLWALLKQQAEKYCGMDSTSLPVETAQELLASLTYTLSEAARADGLSAAALLQSDLAAVLARGQQLLAARRETARRAWNALCLAAPRIRNAYYVDTLKNLGLFFDRYDLYYAAHQIPCSIDYPLLAPVPEQFKGVSYIEAYLRQVGAENRLVNCFAPGAVRSLLQAVDPAYPENYRNLCEPVLTHALGCTLLGAEPRALALSQADVRRLAQLFRGKPQAELAAMLRTAASSLLQSLGFDAGGAACFAQAVTSLAVRAELAAQAGHLTNIFVPTR